MWEAAGRTKDASRKSFVYRLRMRYSILDFFISDNTENRTLNVPVNIPQGVTAESCTAACKSLGGFVQAGLEDGHECCELS